MSKRQWKSKLCSEKDAGGEAHFDTATNFGRAKLLLCPIFSRRTGWEMAIRGEGSSFRSPEVCAARRRRPTAIAPSKCARWRGLFPLQYLPFVILAGSQVVKAFPKVLGRLEAITHFARRRESGWASFRTASIFANRPAFASAIPRWNDLGIHESSDPKMNLATSTRSLGGKALNCLMKACAVMLRINHHRAVLASQVYERLAR